MVEQQQRRGKEETRNQTINSIWVHILVVFNNYMTLLGGDPVKEIGSYSNGGKRYHQKVKERFVRRGWRIGCFS